MERLEADGTDHYRSAPLRGGETASDPERIFQEAIASYVGHRASTLYNAIEALTVYENMLRENRNQNIEPQVLDGMAAALRNVRDDYNRGTGQRVFGYEAQGFFNSEQVPTTRRLSEDIKGFADQTILEGVVSEDFRNMSSLQQRLTRALEAVAFHRNHVFVQRLR